MTNQTSNMGVEDVSFLLDRAAADCAPQQFIREFNQNALEAILKTPEKTGKISWGICPYFLETAGILKLQVSDTGCGMSGEEMVKFINHLASSGGFQALDGNYGLGAKISGLKYNQAGLLYASWRSPEDPGAAILLWRDPITKQYGVKRQDLGAGVFSDFIVPRPELKTKEIQEAGHGTVVVFMGNSDSEDTFSEPPRASGVVSSVEWVAKYLEARYLSFPEGIEVRAQDVDRKKLIDGWMRVIAGRYATINKQAAANGSVPLSNATAFWWILKTGEDKLDVNIAHRIKGCTAAIYQNEVYEQTEGSSRRPRLQQFGVVFGFERVVVYIQPNVGPQLTTNMARTQLRENSEPLSWEAYAEEFRENLPQAIKDLEEEIASSTKSDTSAIKDRLASIMNFFRLSRFRPSTKGTHDIINTAEMGDAPPPSDGPGPGPIPPVPVPYPKSHPRPHSRGTLVFGVTAKEGSTAVEIPNIDIPQVNWFPQDGQPLPEDLLDRAAMYEPRTNTISANLEFAGVVDMMDHWSKTHRGAGMDHAVRETVKEAFEMQLIETILGLQSLKNRKYWTDEQIERAWSSEALTAAVASRSQLVTFIRRQLGSKFGAASVTNGGQ
jgi:hypothetical protein